jgi:hypothetical protein
MSHVGRSLFFVMIARAPSRWNGREERKNAANRARRHTSCNSSTSHTFIQAMCTLLPFDGYQRITHKTAEALYFNAVSAWTRSPIFLFHRTAVNRQPWFSIAKCNIWFYVNLSTVFGAVIGKSKMLLRFTLSSVNSQHFENHPTEYNNKLYFWGSPLTNETRSKLDGLS